MFPKQRAAGLSRSGLLLASLAFLGALSCTTASRREAVPASLQAKANVVGFPAGIRYFPRDAAHVEEFERDYLGAQEREKAYLQSQGHTGPLPPSAFLAL